MTLPNVVVVESLKMATKLLGVIPAEELRQHVQDCERELSRADSIGAILDPTGWIRGRQDGSSEDAKLQLDIVRHLLRAREAMDAREAHCAPFRKRTEKVTP